MDLMHEHEPKMWHGAEIPPSRWAIRNHLLLALAERKLQGMGDVHDQFMLIMKDYRGGRIDRAAVVQRMLELFSVHRDLVEWLNNLGRSAVADSLHNAYAFMDEIHSRFGNNAVSSLQDNLDSFLRGRKSLSHVYSDVSTMFKDHDDLIHKFLQFFIVFTAADRRAGDHGSQLNQNNSSSQDNAAGRQEDKRNQDNQNKSCPQDSASKQSQRPLPQLFDMNEHPMLLYICNVENALKDDSYRQAEFMAILTDLINSAISVNDSHQRLETVLPQQHCDDVYGICVSIQEALQAVHPDSYADEDVRVAVISDHAPEFYNQIKARFEKVENVFKIFVGVLEKHFKKEKSAAETYQEVHSLFSRSILPCYQLGHACKPKEDPRDGHKHDSGSC